MGSDYRFTDSFLFSFSFSFALWPHFSLSPQSMPTLPFFWFVAFFFEQKIQCQGCQTPHFHVGVQLRRNCFSIPGTTGIYLGRGKGGLSGEWFLCSQSDSPKPPPPASSSYALAGELDEHVTLTNFLVFLQDHSSTNVFDFIVSLCRFSYTTLHTSWKTSYCY